MASRFSPIASQGQRFGDLGAMLLAVDVDLGGLDRGLNQARTMTVGATTDMSRNLDRFSRNSRFAFANAGAQVQDFIVQVSSGQNALRAFALQAPQFASAFGPMGTAIGTVIALAAGLGSAFLAAGSDAASAADDIDSLDEALQALTRSSEEAAERAANLATQFTDATAQAREFLVERARLDVGAAEQALVPRQEEFAGVIEQLRITARVAAVSGEMTQEQAAEVLRLIDDYKNLRIGVIEFGASLDRLAAQAAPRVAERLRELRDVGVEVGTSVLSATENLGTAQARLAEVQRLQQQGARIGVETFGPPEAPPAEQSRSTQAVTERERQLESLRTKVRDLQVQMEAGLKLPVDREAAAQIKDLAAAAAILDLSIEELAGADPETRQLAQAYVEVQAALRGVNEEYERGRRAREELQEGLRREAEAERKETEDFAAWQRRMRREEARPGEQRQAQITAGSQLPSDIDMANLAAQELSTTLTNIDGITFDSLLESFVAMGQRLAMMILQALIFKAIMASMGMGGAPVAPVAGAGAGTGGGFAPIFSGAATGAARHGRIFAGGRLMTAQHGAVFSKGQMALMTGAVSGATLLEGAGDEAAVPLVRSSKTGNLSVETSGGGRGDVTNINLSAERIDPGTASFLFNQMSRRVPGLTVNAQKRSMMPRQASF